MAEGEDKQEIVGGDEDLAGFARLSEALGPLVIQFAEVTNKGRVDVAKEEAKTHKERLTYADKWRGRWFNVSVAWISVAAITVGILYWSGEKGDAVALATWLASVVGAFLAGQHRGSSGKGGS